MTKLEATIDVCSYCYKAHQHYAKNLPFNIAKKEAIQICFCCKQSMCLTCVEHSRIELAGTTLAKYGYEICRLCIATVRRSNAVKPRLEKVVSEAVEYVREKMETAFISLMQESTGAPSLKR